jgi:hypothetical protein
MMEAYKFAFAYRPYLGDPEFFPEVEKVGKHIERCVSSESLVS